MDAASAGGAYADVRFMRQRSEYIATRNGQVDDLHHEEDEGIGVRVRVGGAWIFASTEGALFDQSVIETGGGIAATAIDSDEVQVRSYPGSHRGDTMQTGYEHFDAMALVAEAPRVADEAIALLTADACPSTTTT